MKNIFIDGATGTTAFHIHSLLQPWVKSGDLNLISIENNRDMKQRAQAYKQADLTIFCLPDDVAREAAPIAEKMGSRILDASSAHRVNHDWVFGFPEMNDVQADLISKANKVTNPGCFATGALSILRPLVDAGVIDKSQAPVIMGVGGYSAGGKRLIEKFETAAQSNADHFKFENAVTQYGLNGPHKHVKEIKKHAGLNVSPIFMPHTINIPRGMMVTIAFNGASLNASKEEVFELYRERYHKHSILGRHNVNAHLVTEDQARMNLSRFLSVNLNPKASIDDVRLYVSGWERDGERQVTIHATLDNLGKGAATQAVQNARLMLGLRQ